MLHPFQFKMEMPSVSIGYLWLLATTSDNSICAVNIKQTYQLTWNWYDSFLTLGQLIFNDGKNLNSIVFYVPICTTKLPNA